MGKKANRKREVQEPASRPTVNVQLQLPLLDALMGVEEDLFALCVRGDVPEAVEILS